MARYTGPRGKRSRRVQMPLGLTLRDERTKYDVDRLPGGRRPRRATDYGVRLREVQRVKGYYGVLDRQFRRYYAEAERQPGDTGSRLLQLLERRLDNVLYHLRFGLTRAHARQMIVHGHIRVNGRRVDAPSYLVKAGDVLEADLRTRGRVEEAYALTKDRITPSWLTIEAPARGRVAQEPGAADVPAVFDRRMIVEFMAR